MLVATGDCIWTEVLASPETCAECRRLQSPERCPAEGAPSAGYRDAGTGTVVDWALPGPPGAGLIGATVVPPSELPAEFGFAADPVLVLAAPAGKLLPDCGSAEPAFGDGGLVVAPLCANTGPAASMSNIAGTYFSMTSLAFVSSRSYANARPRASVAPGFQRLSCSGRDRQARDAPSDSRLRLSPLQ